MSRNSFKSIMKFGLFCFLFLGYVVYMAMIPHGGIIDGGFWHGRECQIARRELAEALALYNAENEIPLTSFSASASELLVEKGYVEGRDKSNSDYLQCQGGYVPDPPSERASWWYEKELNLLFNSRVLLPLPLTLLFGGTSNGDPGTYSIVAASSSVSIYCSLHGAGTPVPLIMPPGLTINERQLLLAAQEGEVATLSALLASGVDQLKLNLDGKTAIECAVEKGHVAAVKLLFETFPASERQAVAIKVLSRLAKIDKDSYFPNHRDLLVAHKDILAYLAPAIVVSRDPEVQKSLMFLAVFYDLPEAIEQLLANGADVNCKDAEGWTPLYRASVGQKGKIRQLLMNAGAREIVLSLIYEAILANDMSAVEKIVASAPESLRNLPKGFPLVNHCLVDGQYDMALKLSQLGSDPDETSDYGCSVLSLAISRQQDDLVSDLLKRGADVNLLASRTASETAIFTAVTAFNEGKALKYTGWLLDKGANVMVFDDCNETPMHKAATRGRPDILKLFAARGIDLNVSNRPDGKTPLKAARNSNLPPNVIADLERLGMHD